MKIVKVQMLGIILMYFIGRSFYRLAERNGKKKWLFAVLGVVSYYAGTFFMGGILGIFMLYELVSEDIFDNSILLNLIGLPVGLLFCWLFYLLLKRMWANSKQQASSEILDM